LSKEVRAHGSRLKGYSYRDSGEVVRGNGIRIEKFPKNRNGFTIVIMLAGSYTLLVDLYLSIFFAFLYGYAV
jgi:hypothetical protein